MNAIILTLPKINLFEKTYLASRIACLILTSVLLMYLLPIPTRGLVASLISGGLAIMLAIQFFRQSRIANFILGSIIFTIALYFSMAVISEFKEFETVTRDAMQLLGFGLFGTFSIIILSVLMIRRAVFA